MTSFPRYAIYARVSKDSDGTSISPDAQLAECRPLAAALGWEQVTEFVDRNMSAWNPKGRRPGWEAIVQGIRDGTFDGVVMHHLDRFLRRASQLEELIDAVEARAGKRGRFAIHSVHSGEVSLDTADGRFLARILVAVAQKESDDKSRRLKMAAGHRATQGLPHATGNRRPFGWLEDRVTVNPVEAAVIREMVEWVFDGEGLAGCARRLNDAGITTSAGGRWSPATVKRTLTNPRLAGLRTHHGKVVGTGGIEPIIDIDTHRRLAKLLTREAPRRRNTLRHHLVGVLECGRCGMKLRSQSNTGQTTYRCIRNVGGCGNSITCTKTELIVDTITLGVLTRHRVAARHARVQASELVLLEQELAVVLARSEDLARDFYVHNRISRAQFDAANQSLADRITELEELIAKAARVEPGLDAAALWPTLNAYERRELILTVFDKVVVNPATRGRRFDPTRLILHRRGAGHA